MAAPTVVAGQTAYSLTNTVVASWDATLPSAPTEGNLLIGRAGAKDSTAANIETPAGWTRIGDVASTGGSNVATAAFYKVAGAGESATFTVGLTSSQRLWVSVVELEGDFGTPSLFDSGSATSGTSTAFAGTPGSGSMLLYAVSVRTSGGGFGTPSAITVEGDSNATNLSGFAGYDEGATAFEDVTWALSKQWSGLVVEVEQTGSSQAVTPTGASVSAAAGSLTVTTGAVDVSLTGVSVSVTAGTPLVGQESAKEMVFLDASPTFYRPAVTDIPYPVGMAFRVDASPTFSAVTVGDETFTTVSQFYARGTAVFRAEKALGNPLWQHFTPLPRGVNLWILTDGSVVEAQPWDQSTVLREIQGGHVAPDDLTSFEITALTNAGYQLEQI